MKRILAATATLSLLAVGGPALAAAKAPVHAACKAPAGAIVLKPGATYEEATDTPVGAFNEGTEKAGTFVVDLSGRPTSTTSKLGLTLSWENPASDYDLVVGGTNDEAGDNPETRVVKAKHCKPVEVEVSVYLGAPIDEITLKAKAS
jgi:hypothetical protein